MRLRILLAVIFAAFAMPCLAAGIPATNDPNMVFNDNMFPLPDLTNPKDSYLIIIEPKEGDPVQMTLPPGSTGLRVSKAALPSGTWTWKYKVSRQDVPGIKVATPRELTLSTIDTQRCWQ